MAIVKFWGMATIRDKLGHLRFCPFKRLCGRVRPLRRMTHLKRREDRETAGRG